MTENKQEGGFLGGPTIFVQAPNTDIWGEFELPEDKRVENGDKFTIFECRFLGVLYRELIFPKTPKEGETEEFKAASKLWRENLKRKDKKLTFAGGGFVTLIPLEDS